MIALPTPRVIILRIKEAPIRGCLRPRAAPPGRAGARRARPSPPPVDHGRHGAKVPWRPPARLGGNRHRPALVPRAGRRHVPELRDILAHAVELQNSPPPSIIALASMRPAVSPMPQPSLLTRGMPLHGPSRAAESNSRRAAAARVRARPPRHGRQQGAGRAPAGPRAGRRVRARPPLSPRPYPHAANAPMSLRARP